MHNIYIFIGYYIPIHVSMHNDQVISQTLSFLLGIFRLRYFEIHLIVVESSYLTVLWKKTWNISKNLYVILMQGPCSPLGLPFTVCAGKMNINSSIYLVNKYQLT